MHAWSFPPCARVGLASGSARSRRPRFGPRLFASRVTAYDGSGLRRVQESEVAKTATVPTPGAGLAPPDGPARRWPLAEGSRAGPEPREEATLSASIADSPHLGYRVGSWLIPLLLRCWSSGGRSARPARPWCARPTSQQRAVMRARVVLRAADGVAQRAHRRRARRGAHDRDAVAPPVCGGRPRRPRRCAAARPPADLHARGPRPGHRARHGTAARGHDPLERPRGRRSGRA